MDNGDITWEEMWAEEERRCQAAVDAALRADALAPEPYFGGQVPHHPEPQPYFEVSGGPGVGSEDEYAGSPALRVTLPAAPAPSRRRHFGEDRAEGLDVIDWQAPPPSFAPHSSEPEPRGRDWGGAWADGVHRYTPRHAR